MASRSKWMWMLSASLLSAACAADKPTQPESVILLPFANAFANAEWSAPVRLPAPINTPQIDGNPAISKDGLTLYFDSERPGGLGGRDMYVSRRDCPEADCAWQTPLNISTLNSEYGDGGPSLSVDEHMLFFLSHKTRPDCQIDPSNPPADPVRPCDEDLYVSFRTNVHDPLAWGAPIPLGPDVNTSAGEGEPEYHQSGATGTANLFFGRDQDLYEVALRVTGIGKPGAFIETLGPATPVVELNLANVFDCCATIRNDGREIFFSSASAGRGGFGGLDLYTSTRRSVHDPWSPPVNMGAVMNSVRLEVSPDIAHDGRTMYFTSVRQGPPGNWDIWVATRKPGM